MAQTKLPSSQLNLSVTTDANGWTVTDFGVKKMYTYKYTWTGSVAVGANSSYSIPTISLPVGISNRGDIVATWTARCTDRVWLVNERTTDTSTSFALEVNNWYTSTFTLTRCLVDIVAWDV